MKQEEQEFTDVNIELSTLTTHAVVQHNYQLTNNQQLNCPAKQSIEQNKGYTK